MLDDKPACSLAIGQTIPGNRFLGKILWRRHFCHFFIFINILWKVNYSRLSEYYVDVTICVIHCTVVNPVR
jgi:hypothetical protein